MRDFGSCERAPGLAEEEVIPSKILACLRPGARVEVDTAGGGGYGGPDAGAADQFAADLAGGRPGRRPGPGPRGRRLETIDPRRHAEGIRFAALVPPPKPASEQVGAGLAQLPDALVPPLEPVPE